jgi:hypothetical protein
MSALLVESRKQFHQDILSNILTVNEAGIASNADKDSKLSVLFAHGVAQKIGNQTIGERLPGQTSGNQFENICERFLQATFLSLGHLRPGNWQIQCVGNRNRSAINHYEQYAHLAVLEEAVSKNRDLRVALGSDYIIAPDVVIFRLPEPDEILNFPEAIVDSTNSVDSKIANLASLRASANTKPILHASISCKWTIRSDRAQNARSEALNLVRNRKGHLPHIIVITGEPLPSRIASLALGTGDIDCVYHFALPELLASVKESHYEDTQELLEIMIAGKRLKDIADLPLDLAI